MLDSRAPVRPPLPDLDLAIQALLLHVRDHVEGFSHLRPHQILVVAGEARRASRATIKPLTFAGGKLLDATGRRKPEVRIDGWQMRYCITLRPLFFRNSTPQARIGTLLHELFHIGPTFDGTLDPQRRHDHLGPRFGVLFRPVLASCLETLPEALLLPFAHHGEVSVRQWVERPGASVSRSARLERSLYTEAQLYRARVFQVTRRSARAALSGAPGSNRLH